MNYYKLIPKRTLLSLSEKYTPLINGWLAKWSIHENHKVTELKILNAYEMLDKINPSEIICKISDCNGDVLYILDPGHNDSIMFNDLLLGGTFTGKKSDLISSVISNSIVGFCSDVLDIKKPSLTFMIDSIDNNTDADKYLVRGSGAIALEINAGGLVFYVIISNDLFSSDIENMEYISKGLDRIETEDFQIHDREITLSAILEKTSLRYKDLIDLKKNDVLVLDHKISEKLKLNLNESTFCDAQLGSLNGNKAVVLN